MFNFIKKNICFILLLLGVLLIFFVNLFEYGFNFINCVLCVFLFLIVITNRFYGELFDKVLNYIIKYRYIISIVVFVLCVLFKIHGSSIGEFDKYIPDNGNQSIVYGESKSIRSDEWLVMTPYYMSQNYNNYNIYSDRVGITSQNMIIGYNSPVLDITVLSKPICWGYILLGNEYGLSWYWCGKTILFILFSFELFMIITKGKKKLSILGMILLSFGPSTLWWFAPHMPDVILNFMAILVMAYHVVSNRNHLVKNILTIIIPFAILEYVIALFPSFQVGLGWLLLMLLIILLVRDKNKIIDDKKNIIRLIFIAIVSLLLVGYFVLNNIDALQATMNTVYPGARIEIGGSYQFRDLFTDLATPFLSYRNGSPYTNSCEDSTYIHFGFFIMLLFPKVYLKLKQKKNRNRFIGLAILIMLVVYSLFMLFGFPLWMSKLLFFNYINRMKMIVGIISVIFTIWGLSSLDDIDYNINKDYYYLSVGTYSILLLSFINTSLKDFLPFWVYLLEIVFYSVILLLLRNKNKDFCYIALFLLIVFSGFNINPIAVGTKSISNHNSINKVSEIVSNDDSYWMSYNSLIYQGLLIANGAKTLNAVNFYPDFDKWKIIDNNNNYNDNWNRYAHIILNIVSGDNYITNETSPDSINVYLNSETLYSLNVRYIYAVNSDDLTTFNNKNYKYDIIYKDEYNTIYKLIKGSD